MEQFNKRCLETIETNTSRIESKNKYKEERTNPHTLKVGDVLYCSWGYAQTNVDYFKVSEVIGKRIIIIVGLDFQLYHYYLTFLMLHELLLQVYSSTL